MGTTVEMDAGAKNFELNRAEWRSASKFTALPFLASSSLLTSVPLSSRVFFFFSLFLLLVSLCLEFSTPQSILLRAARHGPQQRASKLIRTSCVGLLITFHHDETTARCRIKTHFRNKSPAAPSAHFLVSFLRFLSFLASINRVDAVCSILLKLRLDLHGTMWQPNGKEMRRPQ
jgi:hypothetical protein